MNRFEYLKSSLQERFLTRIKITENGCWEWQGCKDKDGYGIFSLSPIMIGAHRFILLYWMGLTDTSHVVDHLCRNPPCVNPKHLEFVDTAENLLRGEGFGAKNIKKTYCPQGHPYSGSNLIIRLNGSRECRVCVRLSDKKYRLKKRSMTIVG